MREPTGERLAHTDWKMCVGGYGKLFHVLLGRNVGFLEVTQHLPRYRLCGLIHCSDLNSMVHGVVRLGNLDILRHLAIRHLQRAVMRTPFVTELSATRTWRMVTGNLTPWSFHIEVIPLFKAIRPVLVDLGVHFLGSASASGALLVDASSAAGEPAGSELCSQRAWHTVGAVLRCATTHVRNI